MDRHAARPHRLDFEAVGRQFFGYFFVDHQLARRQFQDHGHEHALAFDFARAARFQVLLEQDALVRDVLIDDPQAFAVHRDDETGADLAERLEIGDFVGMRERCRSVAARRREIRRPVRLGNGNGSSSANRQAGFK